MPLQIRKHTARTSLMMNLPLLQQFWRMNNSKLSRRIARHLWGSWGSADPRQSLFMWLQALDVGIQASFVWLSFSWGMFVLNRPGSITQTCYLGIQFLTKRCRRDLCLPFLCLKARQIFLLSSFLSREGTHGPGEEEHTWSERVSSQFSLHRPTASKSTHLRFEDTSLSHSLEQGPWFNSQQK